MYIELKKYWKIECKKECAITDDLMHILVDSQLS